MSADGEAFWREARTRLDAAGIGDAGGKLRWLAGWAFGTGLAGGWARAMGGETPRVGREAVAEAVRRLETGEPVQYVVGETDFLDFAVKCDRRVLIPRPETEEWVGRALGELRGMAASRVADVCTGSGCIAAAVARALPGARVVATDLSEDALGLAAENWRRLGVAERIEARRCDLLGGDRGPYDAVLANPPYVASDACDALDPTVRDFEPRLALDGGADGLEVVRRLAREAGEALRPGGRLWIEIGDDQGADAEDALWKTEMFREISVRCDFAGRARCVAASRA